MLPLRPGARPAKSPSLPSLESCWCWPMPCSATAPLTKHGQTPFVQKPLDTLHSYLLIRLGRAGVYPFSDQFLTADLVRESPWALPDRFLTSRTNQESTSTFEWNSVTN